MNKNKVRKILVVRTDRMGDVLLNIPAIRALKNHFNASVTALLNPIVGKLLEGSPEIDEVICFDQERWQKSLMTKLALVKLLRMNKFDLAVVLNPAKRFHALVCLAGIPRRLGYDRKWGFLLTHKIEDKKKLGQKHEVEYNLDLVRAIGANTDDMHISLAVNPEEERFVENLLEKHNINAKDAIIAMHPFASNPAKCWPKERFAALAQRLSLKSQTKIIIIGGQEEVSASKDIISLIKQPVINLTGRLTLRQLAAFLKRCTLLISNDSGPVHIAAAMDVNTVVIFGRNIAGVGPERWSPWGNQHTILHHDPGCDPCLDRDCPYEFKCLTSITLEEVLQAVNNQLKSFKSYKS